MYKSDIMGRFLGFAKNVEYKEHWTWFDQRLSYSKEEYQSVQKWLNENVEASLNASLTATEEADTSGATTTAMGTGGTTSGTESNATVSNSLIHTAVPSSSSLYPLSNSPSIQVTKPSSSDLAEMSKIERQISFALRATSSSANLLYNNFG